MQIDPATQADSEWLREYSDAEETLSAVPPKPTLVASREPQWISTTPPVDNLAPDSFALRGREPVKSWCYHATDGAPIGYVCRYEDRDGKKTVLQWTYGRLDTEDADRWACKHFARPRPLYNLHQLAEKPGAQLVFVEGEKCADAAAAHFSGQVVMTWPGGAQAVQHADLEPLAARERKQAFLWPDNDDAGRAAMQSIGERLFLLGYEVQVVDIPADKPKGWDVADAIEEGLHVMSFFKAHKRAFLAKREDVLPEMPSEPPAEELAVTTRDFVHEPPPAHRMTASDWQAIGLELKGSFPVANLSNVSMMLDHLYPSQIWYDTFLQRVMTYDAEDRSKAREWIDADDIRLTIDLQRRGGMRDLHLSTVKSGVVEHAMKELRNEVQDWLTSLTWDGIERIEQFFPDVCNCADTAYHRAAARNFFISMVARAMRPGCKVDTMVVLEGAQGIFKSSLLEVLGGPWYTIMRDAPESKDFAITLTGKWIIEIAEMDAFSKSDVKTVKRTLSTATDRYRSPYGMRSEDHPRASVMAGTTNRDDWNQDDTGARRFWPVTVDVVRMDLVRENRAQLFAEAMALLKQGAKWWEMPEAETREQQAMRYDEDVWFESIEHHLIGKTTVNVPWILEQLGVDVQHRDKRNQMRVSSVLRRLGWEKRNVREGSKVFKRWMRG